MPRHRLAVALVLGLLLFTGCTHWCRGRSGGGSVHLGAFYHHHDASQRDEALASDRGDRYTRSAEQAQPAADRGERYGDSANNDPAARQRTRD